MKLTGIIFSTFLLGLFAVALINFAILLPEANNVNGSIANNSAISTYRDSLESSLGDSYSASNSSETALGESPVTSTGDNPFFQAVGGIWKGLTVIPKTIYSLTANLIQSTALSGQTFLIIFSVLGAMLLISIVVAVVRFYQQGDGG
jgi:hypothetical protein